MAVIKSEGEALREAIGIISKALVGASEIHLKSICMLRLSFI